MSTQSPLPQNDPMLIAFQKLKHTPEYKNAVNWTIKAEYLNRPRCQYCGKREQNHKCDLPTDRGNEWTFGSHKPA